MPSKKRSKVIYGIKENAVEAETTPTRFAIQAEPSPPDFKNLPFAFYSFLDPSQLGSIPESKVYFLDSEGSLHLPNESMLECLIYHYFRYVHPYLPFIDEGKFWNMYRRPKTFQGQFSLLLLRAMIFSAAPFIPSNVAQGYGFSSPLSLRNNLYYKARLLFFYGNESNFIFKSQTALLLSFHNSDIDAMCNSSWLSIAIKYVKLGNNERSSSSKSSVNQRLSIMKKLWWCCFVRDRVISLGMRRPVQIRLDDFPFVKRTLSLDDFEKELRDSEVYDYETKRALCSIFIAQCGFSRVATDILNTVYPEQANSNKGNFSENPIIFEDMMRLQLGISTWYFEFTTRTEYTGEAGDHAHPSARLFSSLVSMYYQSARIALCNHANRLAADYELPELVRGTMKSYNSELCDAVTHMTESLKHLADANMAKYLPASAMACTVFPLILWGMNVILSSTPADRYRNARNFGLLKGLNQLYSHRFDTKRLSVLIGQTLHFFRPRMVDIAMRYSSASFSDIFEKSPQAYVELYLYLDGLISANQSLLIDGKETFSPPCLPRQGEIARHYPPLNVPDSEQPHGIEDQGVWEMVSFLPNMNTLSNMEEGLPELTEQNEEDNEKLGEDFFDYIAFAGE
ncbi:hypothetical protein N7451_004611 [Penicillium sp. IBT 35674x]|nr:hypothetical protein N7451_004611 [Penicillium sp. IBT 35674x]